MSLIPTISGFQFFLNFFFNFFLLIMLFFLYFWYMINSKCDDDEAHNGE